MYKLLVKTLNHIIHITIPDKEVLNKIKKVINKIESGKELTEKDIEGLN